MITGKTADSITYDRALKVKDSDKSISVYPKGTRSDGNRRSVAEVAFVNEFGTSSQPARPFINTRKREIRRRRRRGGGSGLRQISE